jgi:hypothetical protein
MCRVFAQDPWALLFYSPESYGDKILQKEWAENRRAAITPLAMVLFLIFFYGLFQSVFVRCDKGIAKCQPFNAGYLFPLDSPGPLDQKGGVITGSETDAAKNKEIEVKNRKLIAARYSGRYLWVFLAAVGTILGVVAFITSYLLISKSPANARAASVVVVSLLLGLALYFVPDHLMPVMGAIFNNTIGNSDAKIGMPVIYGTMRLLNSFTYAAAFSIVFASCAILVLGDTNTEEAAADDDGLSNKLELISERMGYLKIILYVGTFLLIAGVLRMSALSQWTLSFISPNAVEAAQSFSNSVVAVAGGFNTLILAAVYLPAAYILQRRARLAVMRLPLKPEDREQKLKDKGLTFSFRESLPRVAAMLGPLLAGPIGDLFKNIPA